MTQTLWRRIAGNREAVIKVNDNETLKKLIRVVSVTASMVGSKSRTDESQTGEVLREISREMKGDPDIVIPEPSPEPDPVDTGNTDASGGGWDTGSSGGWDDDWD